MLWCLLRSQPFEGSFKLSGLVSVRLTCRVRVAKSVRGRGFVGIAGIIVGALLRQGS